jgi:hypothetical protein
MKALLIEKLEAGTNHSGDVFAYRDYRDAGAFQALLLELLSLYHFSISLTALSE